MIKLLNDNKEILAIEKGNNGDTIIVIGGDGIGMGYVLSPQQLLEVRDYINERVRELIFKGVLQDRLLD